MDTQDAEGSYKTFEEFWPFYLKEHSDPQCRVLHLVGTTSALTFVAVALLTRDLGWFFHALIAGYGGAWLGHYKYQKNRPATFKYPLMSLKGDMKMFFLSVTGELDRELAKYSLLENNTGKN